MPHIMGFIGLAGAGKDTAAQAMVAEFRRQGQTATIDSFAYPIREISRLVCLDPYDRHYKELRHCYYADWFCAAFHAAIETVLGDPLSEHERAELYAYTIEALTPFIREMEEGRPAIHISPREFMQVLGTEGGQRVRKTLWLELAAMRWRNDAGAVLVPDVRFEHELALLDNLIVVVRDGVQPVNNHASERLAAYLSTGGTLSAQHLPKVTWLCNDSSLSSLEWAARNLVKYGFGKGDLIA